MQNKRPIVVILGMHRSGTSLLANFVSAVGIDVWQDKPADKWNAAGYWESLKIMEIHQKILKQLNWDWHNPPLSFPPYWWRRPEIQESKKELLEFVRSECKRTKNTPGFKDPRTAILLPIWKEIFEELQLQPLYLLTVRHPGPVAASIASRDHLTFARSQVLWLRTYLEALSQTRNCPLTIVDYDRWFDSPMEQAKSVVLSLHLTESAGEEQLANAVKQTVHDRLRHHSSKQDQTLSQTVARFYSLLRSAAIDGRVSDEIWTITEDFEKARDLLSLWDDLLDGREEISHRTVLRKQRQLFSYIIIAIVVVFSLLLLFALYGSHNWSI